MNDDEKVPFSRDECEVLIGAMTQGHKEENEELTEFKVRQFFEWASKVRADTMTLDMLLEGKMNVSKVRHYIEETCTFNLSIRS